jgi:hypothetical protein
VVPLVGAWDADDHYYGCVTGETRAIPRALSLLDVDNVAPLYGVESSVSASCLSIGQVLLCDSRTRDRCDRRRWN